MRPTVETPVSFTAWRPPVERSHELPGRWESSLGGSPVLPCICSTLLPGVKRCEGNSSTLQGFWGVLSAISARFSLLIRVRSQAIEISDEGFAAPPKSPSPRTPRCKAWFRGQSGTTVSIMRSWNANRHEVWRGQEEWRPFLSLVRFGFVHPPGLSGKKLRDVLVLRELPQFRFPEVGQKFHGHGERGFGVRTQVDLD